MDENSLSHTTWRCKYHIVFAPKYRRRIIYGKIKIEIGKILRALCDRKGVKILEAEACPDHIRKTYNRDNPRGKLSEMNPGTGVDVLISEIRENTSKNFK